jgi:Cu(I)/Ag(I) efflux system membrane protein CusA/SilA
MGGNYVEIDIVATRSGATADRDVQDAAAAPAACRSTTVEGLERYNVILRYDRDYRENLRLFGDLIPVKSCLPALAQGSGRRHGPATGDRAASMQWPTPLGPSPSRLWRRP